MGLASNIIAIIIKSVVSSKSGNGLSNDLIGISIDEFSEKGINTIKNFINEEKSKIEYILSDENMKEMNIAEENIGFVVAEIKELLSEIEITDELFNKCRYNYEELEEFLWGEYHKQKSNIENESDIKRGLYVVTKALINLKCKSDGFEKELLIQISNSVKDANVELKKLSDYMEESFDKLDQDNRVIFHISQRMLKYIQSFDTQKGNDSIAMLPTKIQNNKKQEYIDNWNSRLFLHLDNDERPLTLENAFIMPDYKMHRAIPHIGFSEKDTLDKIINKFIKYRKTSTMLITGVPGIGKTTITSWLAAKYKEDNSVIILRFRDWESEELEKGILKAIYTSLECKKAELDNKVLILDGFDEMKSLDIGRGLLSNFFNAIKDFNNFKCIITSRTGYIDSDYFGNVFQLQEFNIEQVKKFYKNITGKSLGIRKKIESNLEVLGIPVILYMAIMSDVDIGENPTKPELYNRIFAVEGGIFDKFYNGNVEYDNGTQVLRDSENIKKYLEFLNRTAFKMFQKRSLSITKEECGSLELKFMGKSVNIVEFPIKYFFENTESNIEFIHKSIYEYFVSEYIFLSIKNKINNNVLIEELAGVFGGLLRWNNLTFEILEFLRFKIRDKLKDKFDIVFATFQLMLCDGMSYYTKECYKNVIGLEIRIFKNMLEIIHLWEYKSNLRFENSILGYMMSNFLEVNSARLNEGKSNDIDLEELIFNNGESATNLSLNLRKVDFKSWNLKRINLENADLRNSDLSGSDLSNANLLKVDLTDAALIKTILRGADMSNAILSGADLRRAELKGADLQGAELKGADLREANLYGVNLSGADLEDSIWHIDDIPKVFSQLKGTRFEYIIVEESNNREKVSRSKLFDKK